MKAIITLNPSKQNNSISKKGLVIAILLLPVFVSAQNLISNSLFGNRTTGWTSTCSVEINSETTYGGANASNSVTEIDEETSVDQDICVMTGVTLNSFRSCDQLTS